MRKINELIGAELVWRQPNALKMEYELLANNQTAATLRFRSSFGTLATAESADGCWTFKRVGFWKPHVTIRVCGAETDMARFHHNTWTGGGTLELPDRRRYSASTNVWQTNLEFKTESDTALVRLKNGGVFRLTAQVEILPTAQGLPETPWIVMLGCYLVVMLSIDSAAATAAASG